MTRQNWKYPHFGRKSGHSPTPSTGDLREKLKLRQTRRRAEARSRSSSTRRRPRGPSHQRTQEVPEDRHAGNGSKSLKSRASRATTKQGVKGGPQRGSPRGKPERSQRTSGALQYDYGGEASASDQNEAEESPTGNTVRTVY